jgi:hypothetical protein
MSNQARREDQPGLWGDSRPSSMGESGPQIRRPVAAPATSRTRSAPMLPTQRPSKPMDYSELWTIDDVANYLGVPKQTIYSWRHTGTAPRGSGSASTCAGDPPWSSRGRWGWRKTSDHHAAVRSVRPSDLRGSTSASRTSEAVLRSPAACRRVLRQIGEWAGDGTLDDAKWSSIAEEIARLARRVAPRRRLR